jgi:SOS-response transcriptional repressor LexA
MHMHLRFNARTMKTTLGQRIKERRKALELSQERLGALAGLDQTVISKLERGDVQETAKIAELAHALDCDALWLATGKGAPDIKNKNKPRHDLHQAPLRGRVPLISLVAAGHFGESVDNFAPGSADEWVDTTVPVKRHTYALRVSGDSMTNPAGSPSFPEGVIIIVEPEEEARNKSYVIVRQNGEETTFKQLVIDGGRTYLKPLNPRYPIMEIAPDAVICGVVKQMVMDV